MNRQRAIWILIGLAVVGAAGGALLASLRGPSEPPVRAWLLEYDSLQRSLGALRDRAFSDPVVASARQRLGDSITVHMRVTDPSADSLLRRADALERQMESLRAGEGIDPQRYAELLREYEEIRATVEPAERAAFLDPAIQRQFEAFRRLLDTKMIELARPEERRALGRVRAIEAQIEALPPGMFDSLAALPEGES